jgi:hypothetical protein
VKTGIANAPGVGLAPDDVTAMTARSPGPEALARKVRRGIQRDKALVRYGADAYLFSFFRLLPQWLLDPLGKFMARTAAKFLRGELKPK